MHDHSVRYSFGELLIHDHHKAFVWLHRMFGSGEGAANLCNAAGKPCLEFNSS